MAFSIWRAFLLSLLSTGPNTANAFTHRTQSHSNQYKGNEGRPSHKCRGLKALMATIDKTMITTKDYEDIMGENYYTPEQLEKRMDTRVLKYPKHVAVIEDFDDVVEVMVDEILLETGEKSWQPQDYLPDMASEGWLEEVMEMREMAATVSDEVLITLIGDMVTEEALPTYQTLLNTFEGCDDPIGTSETAWAKWSRGWTSEENRHGDLLNKYLYLGGRCDMRSIEVTIQHLITDGFNPGANQDPYRGFIYTSFQERATKISHGNVGKLAGKCGDKHLQRICAKIAGDEGRHERAYQQFSQEILDRDPNGFLMEFADMMKGMIVMPAELMTDGKDPDLYDNFSAVAQRLGVYTAFDYSDILEHLVKRWNLDELDGLNSDGEKDRDYLCKLAPRMRKLATWQANKTKKATDDVVPTKSFNWIYGRKV